MAAEQPPKLVQAGLTSTGLSILTLASVTLLIGIGLKNGALVALGSIVILLLTLAIIPGRRAARSLRFDLALPQRTRADRAFPLLVSIQNNSRILPTPPLHASLIFPSAPAINFDAESIPPKGKSRLRLRSRNLPRGIHKDWDLIIESEFPLGLFQFSYKCKITCQVRAIPRALASDEREEIGSNQLGNPSPLSGHSGDEEEFVSLRSYRSGDSLRRIHWPTSNRGRGLVIREVEYPGQLPSQVTLIFHSVSSGSLIRPNQFERALSTLAGLIEQFVKANRIVEIRADFDDYKTHRIRQNHQLRKYLDFLAEVSRCANSSKSKLQQAIEKTPESHHLVIVSDSDSARSVLDAT